MDDAEEELELTDAVEQISDVENLLVLGEDRRSVKGFLRPKGLLEKGAPDRTPLARPCAPVLG